MRADPEGLGGGNIDSLVVNKRHLRCCRTKQSEHLLKDPGVGLGKANLRCIHDVPEPIRNPKRAEIVVQS